MKRILPILITLSLASPTFAQEAACNTEADLLQLEQDHSALFLGIDAETDVTDLLSCFANAPRQNNRKLLISLERIEDHSSNTSGAKTQMLIKHLQAVSPQIDIVFHDGGIGPYTNVERREFLAPWGHTGRQLLAIAREDAIARSVSRQLSKDVFLIAINSAAHVSKTSPGNANLNTAGAQLSTSVTTVDLTRKSSQSVLTKAQTGGSFDYAYIVN